MYIMDNIYGVMDNICQNNKISQQELDLLYTSLGVSSKSVRQQLSEEEEKLEGFKQLSYRSKFMDIFNEEEDEKIRVQQERVDVLRKIKESGDNVGRTFLFSMTGGTLKTRIYPSLEVRNKVFLGNIDLAKKIALRYFYKNNKKYDFDDLFQIACEALLSASYYYVPLGEAKFSTYANKCMENRLKREISSRKKKSSLSGFEFLKDRQDVVRYLKMFLDGGLSLQRLNKSIIKFNRDVFNLGEDSRVLPRPLRGVNRENYSTRYDQIVMYFAQALKDSNLNSLISDEDRQFVSRLANYRSISGRTLDIWTLRQYVNLYMQKLMSAIWYLEIEDDLIRQNDGDVPDNADILNGLNRRVRDYNAKIREFPKGYWQQPFLKSRALFDDEYSDEFSVDLASEKERSGEREEIKAILCDIYYSQLEVLECKYNKFLVELRSMAQDAWLTCHFKSVNLDGMEITCVDFYDETDEVDDKSERMDVASFRELLISQLDYFHGQFLESLVDRELQRRREVVSENLRKKNDYIFECNGPIFEYKELYSLWGEHKRLYTEADLNAIQRDICILYSEDEELVASKRCAGLVADVSLEDQVIGNLFLEDYYRELSKLDDIQRDILLNWFDQNGVHATSARDIATKLGITPNKVYKEKAKALRKLASSEVLKSYNEV